MSMFTKVSAEAKLMMLRGEHLFAPSIVVRVLSSSSKGAKIQVEILDDKGKTMTCLPAMQVENNGTLTVATLSEIKIFITD